VDRVFLLKLFLSFTLGGFWVVLATVLADKLGPKVGGLVSGLPSTVALGLFFLAWTQSTGAAVQAAAVVPLVAGINSLFLANYVYWVRQNVRLAVLSSLALWFVLAAALVSARFDDFAVSLIGFGFLFLLSFYLMERVFKIVSVRGKVLRHAPRLILARALGGGLAVSLAVYLGKVGGPLWGGVFSTFPAMFISTMLVTYFAHGPAFSAGVMKNAMLSGTSVVVYAVAVRTAYPLIGLGAGTLVSLLVSLGSGWAIYRGVIRRVR
jgi:hypothetical protein